MIRPVENGQGYINNSDEIDFVQAREIYEIGAIVEYDNRGRPFSTGNVISICRQPFKIGAQIDRAEFERRVIASGHTDWLLAPNGAKFFEVSTD